MCGSFTIAGKRVADPEVYVENCSRCGILYQNPIKHALLYCREMEIERNTLWDWFLDKLPIVVSSTLYLMDDDQFLYTLFGDLPRMDSSEDYVDMFKLRVARYISKTYKLFFFS